MFVAHVKTPGVHSEIDQVPGIASFVHRVEDVERKTVIGTIVLRLS
jgi:hypothetical protein